MNESQPADPVGARADSALRERQLLLMQAVDERLLDQSNTLADTLHFIVSETKRVLNASHVDILFGYADGLRVELSSDEHSIGYFIPFEQSIQGLVILTHRPVLINDLQSDPLLRERYFPRVADPADRTPPLSVVAAEITLDGQAIGVINVEAPSADGRFDQSHLDFVEAIGRHISLAITHAALFDEDDFRTATDKLLVDAGTRDSDLVIRVVLDRILSALDSLAFIRPEGAEILLTDPQDSQSLIVAYSTNTADIGVRVGLDSTICGEAFRSGVTVVLPRAMEHPAYRPMFMGMHCEMAIPILFGGSNRFPIGVLNLESTRENAFSTVGQVLAERFARRMANAIAMTKMRADIDSELQDQLMVLAADQVLNAIHRINNYVGSIRAIAADLLDDLASASPPDRDDLTHALQVISQDAERALEIPDELRKRIIRPQASADVNAQVEAGLASVRIPRHITVTTELAAGLPKIPCAALDLVVENLVLNAVKAMQDGPGSLRIMTRLDERLPREPFIVVTVQDTGVGMTKEEQDHLFEPRRGRRGSGLGFGMMWVRSWVRRAQGLIDIESVPGSGTTVNIRFQIDPHLIDKASEGGE